ncbi:hypothetical protein KFL_003530030 [Klebsormidium nitens]|uniref:Uncharacterized protein n=1 Tax=Klebsormidium nitens TaxID=105231 RepID=A0A1Y1IDC7_KLENI|nr:hypothetical protein KFL_003530030 [Klebsormidium nitens]|eukprot:GAQ87439.1 hypothetical protein KFL_003530030 [Klebsormidium nitens]
MAFPSAPLLFVCMLLLMATEAKVSASAPGQDFRSSERNIGGGSGRGAHRQLLQIGAVTPICPPKDTKNNSVALLACFYLVRLNATYFSNSYASCTYNETGARVPKDSQVDDAKLLPCPGSTPVPYSCPGVESVGFRPATTFLRFHCLYNTPAGLPRGQAVLSVIAPGSCIYEPTGAVIKFIANLNCTDCLFGYHCAPDCGGVPPPPSVTGNRTGVCVPNCGTLPGSKGC